MAIICSLHVCASSQPFVMTSASCVRGDFVVTYMYVCIVTAFTADLLSDFAGFIFSICYAIHLILSESHNHHIS